MIPCHDRRQRRRRAVVMAAIVLLAACSRPSGGGVAQRARVGAATSTTPAVAPATAASTTTLTTAASTTTPATGAAACLRPPARAEPPAVRPRYTITADVRPAEGAAEGEVRVVFVPEIDTDRLVFRLWPNGPRSGSGAVRLEAGPVTSGGTQLPAAQENPTTLVVRPPGGLRAGQAIDVTVPWRLHVPGSFDDRISAAGDSMRLGSFFPILSWEPGVGWATEPAVGQFAEASSAPTADFDVTVTTPPGYDVLASGVNDRAGHWTATAMRDFAMSVGHFRTESAVAHAPQPVQVTVGVHDSAGAEPGQYLGRVVAAIEDFARRFGPYPWPNYTLAITPNLGGGIEYPSHVMQGPGTSGRTTSHEVAHQWFYALVGNDQGRDPWLDEGLATYAEARIEGTIENIKRWPVPPVARGAVHQPMTFWEQQSGAYYTGVYVQGAQAVAALGPLDLVDCALRLYAARNAYRTAQPADLVDSATVVFADAGQTLARFGVRGR